MKAINILWDVDDPEELEDEDEISDYISDVTGFCHAGFALDTEKNEEGE